MKSEIKKLEGSQIEISVELDKEEFAKHWQPAYDGQAKDVKVKGFRDGKAPKEMLDGGVDKDKAFEEALRNCVRVNLSELSQENKWIIIDQPRIEVSEMKDDGGLKYKAILTLFPDIQLPDYKKLAKKILAEKKEAELTDEEIQKSIDYILNSRAKETRVERASKKGDLVEIDLKTKVDGKEVASASLKKDRFIIGQSRFLDGFDEKLVGQKDKKELEFSLTAPADYWQKEFQGKQFDFKMKIHGVFEREVPKLDDKFAESLGADFKDVAGLRKSVKEGLTQEKEGREHERVQIKLIEAIADGAKMEIPPVMKEKMLEAMVNEGLQMLAGQQNISGDKLREEMKKQYKDAAEKRVRVNLVIQQIAQDKKLTPSKEEIDNMAKLQNIDPEQHYNHIYGSLINKKVFDFLFGLGQDKK